MKMKTTEHIVRSYPYESNKKDLWVYAEDLIEWLQQDKKMLNKFQTEFNR